MGGPIEKTESALLADLLTRVRNLEIRAAISGRSAYVGEVRMLLGPDAPSGWAVLDGSVYDPELYPQLFALIGNSAGGTTSAPLLPDWRGRVPVARDPADPLLDVLGEKGGAKLHSHFQTIGADGNSLYIRQAAEQGLSPQSKVITATRAIVGLTYGVGSARFDGTEDATSMQPYVVANFVVRLG